MAISDNPKYLEKSHKEHQNNIGCVFPMTRSDLIIATTTRNKLGLSWAKLSSNLANYARYTNCLQLDCLPCENCQYRHIRHLNLVILNTRI